MLQVKWSQTGERDRINWNSNYKFTYLDKTNKNVKDSDRNIPRQKPINISLKSNK